MSPLYPSIGPAPGAPKDYQEFWNGLPRDVSKYEYYRAHQLKILEEYQGIASTQKDVAICLPTGTGKTVIGLSIARFAQVGRKQLVLYLSPYILLASQILEEAKGLGIPAVPLYGTWSEVEQSSKDAYFAGEAIGVATYSALFNANPRLGKPELIILDDVHAAGDFVLSPWVTTIRSDKDPEAFQELASVLKEQVPGVQVAALGPHPSPERAVEMVRTRDWLLVVDAIQPILDRHTESSSWKFGWMGIRDKLSNCFCFLAPGSITIRPWVPPTFELPEFAGAKRRVYLSATVDRWGNIEHIMGVESVSRVTLPTVPIPGRRLILNLNRLLPGMGDIQRVVHMASRTEKALVLCKSARDRDEVISELKKAHYSGSLLGTGTIEHDVKQFRAAKNAILALANRYDGLDLGDGVCRNLILWKLPLAIGDQEEFATYIWRLVDSAESRGRQRVQQGMGRCTRRDADAVAIGLVGKDLVEFLLHPKVRAAMPRRLRAELELCAKLDDSSQFEALVQSCMRRTSDWKTVGGQVDSLAAASPDETYPDEEVMEIHRREARYSRLLWTRDYPAASACAQSAAQELVKRQSESAAAVWFYLASAAEDLHQFEASGSPYSAQGAVLLGEARSRQEGRTWFGELASYAEPPRVAQIHEAQVAGIERFLKAFPPQTLKLDEALDDALSNLAQTQADRYHRGLKLLGESLGLESEIPKREAAADVIWSLGRVAAMIFEAKTGKALDSALSVHEVRQIINLPSETRANEHLTVPDSFLATCVTDCRRIAKEEKHEVDRFTLARPGEIQEFAQRWFGRLRVVHKRAVPGTAEGKVLVQAALKQLRAAQATLASALGVKPARGELEAED